VISIPETCPNGSDRIQPQNVAEAVGFRTLDRSVWA